MKHSRSASTAVALLVAGLAACHHDAAPSNPAPASPLDSGSAPVPDAVPSAAQADPPAPAAQFTGTAQFLPQGSAVTGWTQSGAVRHATPHDLFQIMDGEAASYEQYGVRDYASAEYRAPHGTLVTQVQIYAFADALGAFGRYSLSTTDGRDPASLQPQGIQRGGGGFMGSTELDFWKGDHLVQVSLQDADGNADEAALTAAARDALPRFAETLDHALEGTTTVPANPLADEGMVWGGRAYLADGAFGAEHTGPAWLGYYRAPDGKRYRVGVMARENLADAQRAFAALRMPTAAPVVHVGDEAYAVSRGDAGELVVARRANTVFVVADAGVPNAPSPDRVAKTTILRALLATPTTPAAPQPTAAADPTPAPTAPVPTPAAPAPAAGEPAAPTPMRSPYSAIRAATRVRTSDLSRVHATP